jgi:hypothetical protein
MAVTTDRAGFLAGRLRQLGLDERLLTPFLTWAQGVGYSLGYLAGHADRDLSARLVEWRSTPRGTAAGATLAARLGEHQVPGMAAPRTRCRSCTTAARACPRCEAVSRQRAAGGPW